MSLTAHRRARRAAEALLAVLLSWPTSCPSTGGGASLKMLEGESFANFELLDDK